MLNDWNMPKMSDLGTKCAGHEGAGVIVKVGERVKSYKVGQRAGFKPIQDVCHTCEYCRTGRETYCQKAVFTGCFCDGGQVPTHTTRWLTSSRILQAIRRLTGEIYHGEPGIEICKKFS